MVHSLVLKLPINLMLKWINGEFPSNYSKSIVLLFLLMCSFVVKNSFCLLKGKHFYGNQIQHHKPKQHSKIRIAGSAVLTETLLQS